MGNTSIIDRLNNLQQIIINARNVGRSTRIEAHIEICIEEYIKSQVQQNNPKLDRLENIKNLKITI